MKANSVCSGSWQQEEASISFAPPLTKAEKEGREGAGHEGAGDTLAVDPSRNRVYVLTHYEPQNAN